MPVWILVVVTVFLIVSEGMFVYEFIKMHDKITDMRSEYEFFKNVVKINNKTNDDIIAAMGKNEELCNSALKLCEAINSQYDLLYEQYGIIKNNHLLICDHYSQLLNTWKRIEERYDCAYEEYKSCSERLNALLERPFSTEDEYYLDTNEACDMVCINCTLEKCIEEKCPVRMLQKRLVEGMKT